MTFNITYSATRRWIAALGLAALALLPEGARAADPDVNLPAVKAVCGRCHSESVFLNQTRSWDRWNDVFADMVSRGADGTDEQMKGVATFFLENLTVVNVNTAPLDELAGVLGVTEQVAQDIISRRERQKFSSLAQLRAVPGVDKSKIEQKKSRIFF